MSNTSSKDLFRDYYVNNKGILFKSFEICIGNFHHRYDIYWGDSSVIFDAKTLAKDFPLAVTTIPHRYGFPNPRIFLHEKLEKENNGVFELIIAHEIGHLWLHDIVGFNNPSTSYSMNENESEAWADYFAYSFFARHRHISGLDDFAKILKQVSSLQLKIYDLDPKLHTEYTYTRKIEKLKAKTEEIDFECKKANPTIIHLKNAIEVTLNALGDIFK